MPLLEVRSISKRFGGVRALDGMSLSVDEGEIVGLIGPNGAGKTSFFNVITGILPADEGEIFFQGGQQSLRGLSSDKILKKGLARTFQNLRIFKNMTLLENIAVGMYSRTQSSLWSAFFRTRRFHVEEKKVFKRGMGLLDLMGLANQGNEIAANLSYGNQKRLEIARALATEPKLLLLDEPVAGMNPSEKEEISNLIRKIQKRGIAVLLIEHDMKVVMPLSNRVVVMDDGKKIAEGPPEEIRKNPRVIQAYLGEA